MDRPGFEKVGGEWVRTHSSLLREKDEKATANADARSAFASTATLPPPPPPPLPLALEGLVSGSPLVAALTKKTVLAELTTAGEGEGEGEGESEGEGEGDRSVRPLSRKQALAVAPLSKAALMYPPLAGVQHPYASSMRLYQRVARQVIKLQASQQPDATVGVMLPESERRVRFVHISDTHHHHKHVTNVPSGDVLIMTGDLVGNYGREDDTAMLRQLRNSLLWLAKLAKRFDAVFIVAGNHDTMLDRKQYPDSFTTPAYEMIRQMPSHVTFLDAEASPGQIVHYRGLTIYGCPVVVSRLETMGARYYSNAFERTLGERRAIWDRIPANLDILLTHTPPRGVRSNLHGCGELARCLDNMVKRSKGAAPKVHCFGHDHASFGLNVNEMTGTLEVNAAQEDLVRAEHKVGVRGACALTFDMIAPM